MTDRRTDRQTEPPLAMARSNGLSTDEDTTVFHVLITRARPGLDSTLDRPYCYNELKGRELRTFADYVIIKSIAYSGIFSVHFPILSRIIGVYIPWL